jgi:hypothetical protein
MLNLFRIWLNLLASEIINEIALFGVSCVVQSHCLNSISRQIILCYHTKLF